MMGLFSQSKEKATGSTSLAGSPKQKAPSDKLTALHVFYICIWHGCGAMIIAGGANFGIATGMP